MVEFFINCWREIVHVSKYLWPSMRASLYMLVIVSVTAGIIYAQVTIKWRLRVRRWGDRLQVDIIKDQEFEIETQKAEIEVLKENYSTLEIAHRESYGLMLKAQNTMMVIRKPKIVKRRMANG